MGLAVDDRLVNGEEVWLKPAKFSMSIIIYNVTLAWLLSLLSLLARWQRTGWWGALTLLTALGLAWVLRVSSGQPDEGDQECGSSSTYTTSSTRAGTSTRP